MSNARASVLDKKMPFRLLSNIGVLYVPESIEERRKTVHPPIIPTPDFYPVHAFAPVSSNLQATETTPITFECWAHSYYTQGSTVQLSGYYGHNYGYGLMYSFGPSHGHSHEHSSAHGHSHGHTYASQTSSLGSSGSTSTFSTFPPQSGSVSAPQSFTANMPESLPCSVMVYPGAPDRLMT